MPRGLPCKEGSRLGRLSGWGKGKVGGRDEMVAVLAHWMEIESVAATAPSSAECVEHGQVVVNGFVRRASVCGKRHRHSPLLGDWDWAKTGQAPDGCVAVEGIGIRAIEKLLLFSRCDGELLRRMRRRSAYCTALHCTSPHGSGLLQ